MEKFANRPAISAEEKARMSSHGTSDISDSNTDIVIAVTCHLFGIEQNALLSHRRWPEIVKARAFLVWCMRAMHHQPISYPAIGRLIERDHTTVMHLHRKAIVLRMIDREFASLCTGFLAAYRKVQVHVGN